MTNTLHRFGPREDLQDDYIVFAMCTRGQNDVGAVHRLKQFLSICVKYSPVNIGDATKGGLLRPSSNLTPLVHWRRTDGANAEAVINGVSAPTTVSAVYDNPAALTACLKEVKEADLGLSINVAALTDNAQECALDAGIQRHAVEYSFGFSRKEYVAAGSQHTGAHDDVRPWNDCRDVRAEDGFGQDRPAKAPRMHPLHVEVLCVRRLQSVRAERLLCRIANQSAEPKAS